MPEFAAMTADLDQSIGLMLDRLIELDLRKNTYLVFMSDNGGRTSIPKAPKTDIDRNAPLRDGKHSFYEGGIRVPFIVSGPGVQPGSVCRVPVTGLDLLPTFADLAGYPRELPHNIDGGSLRHVLHRGGEGQVQRRQPFLIFHQAVDRKLISAIRLGNYKLVKTWRKNKLERFDLSRDLGEVDDLSTRRSKKTQELESLLLGFLGQSRRGHAQPRSMTPAAYRGCIPTRPTHSIGFSLAKEIGVRSNERGDECLHATTSVLVGAPCFLQHGSVVHGFVAA